MTSVDSLYYVESLTLRVLAQQHEVAGVGDQNETIQPPILADLGAAGGEPGVVASRLDLHHPTIRDLPLLGLALRYLPGGVDAEVRMPHSLLGRSEPPTALSRLDKGG